MRVRYSSLEGAPSTMLRMGRSGRRGPRDARFARLAYKGREKPRAPSLMPQLPASIDETLTLLSGEGYVADRALATVLFLSLRMGRPLFLEGEAGVGKTEIAKVLAGALGRKLIRLQCYEGLDVAARRLRVELRRADDRDPRSPRRPATRDRDTLIADVFAERFLIRRPLLQALEPDPAGAPVLLIDELDRADEAFEAFLLEVLADNQVTIPELGTIRAATPPIVVVTTNRTREIHDALKRRCLYHWVDYPDAARELAIVRDPRARRRRAAVAARSSPSCSGSAREDLFKKPGVAETLDWATALTALDAGALDRRSWSTRSASSSNTRTTSSASTRREADRLLEEARAEAAA